MRRELSFGMRFAVPLVIAMALLAACRSASATYGTSSEAAEESSFSSDDSSLLTIESDATTSTTVDAGGVATTPAQTPSPTTSPTPTTAPYVPRPLTPGLAGKVIVIDAGHNGGNFAHINEINQLVDAGNGVTKQCDTTGTGSFDGYPEYAFNLSVALELQATLQAAGAQVVMVRSDSNGWGPCITERARIGNDARADLAISIHGDGNDTHGARGFHVLVPVATSQNAAMVPAAQRFGSLLRDAFGATGMPVSNYLGSNGVMYRGDLGGLNLSVVPKVFIECGNMHNREDLALMRSGTFQRNAANAISTAMGRYFG